MAPATHSRLSFLIFSLLSLTTTTTSAAASATNFIQSQCSSTAYPTVCFQSLSSYANKIHHSPRQLAQTALTVSLAKAHYAKAYVARMSHTSGLRPRESGALKDCFEEICDTVDWLAKSVHEFQVAVRARPGSGEFMWHISNVQTWASAALTDENTCVDGLEGREFNGPMKSTIKAQFAGVLECTSNALALVNQFANKYSH